MIEVRKYIPQVYNQSRDFSVFMGVMQIALNELDIKSRSLESLPSENFLPHKLNEFISIRSELRGMLKRKGSIMCLLYAITLAGGMPPSFDEEDEYLNNLYYVNGSGNEEKLNYSGYLDRSIEYLEELNSMGLSSYKERYPGDIKKILSYYTEREGSILKLHINLKDLSKINQDLLNKLWYYLKPINTVIMLEQYGG